MGILNQGKKKSRVAWKIASKSKQKKMVSTKHMNKPWITPTMKRSIKTNLNYFNLYRRGIFSREVNGN